MFFVSVASKELTLHKNCALCCESGGGHKQGQELAGIVPRSYCTRGIWARQEEKAVSGGVSNWLKGMSVADAGENWAFWHPFSEGVSSNRRNWESIQATLGEMQFPDFGSRYIHSSCRFMVMRL